MQEKILTPDQVAQILQVHPFTVLKFIKQGKLKASKLGRVYRIRESDLEGFLEQTSSNHKKTEETSTNIIKKTKNKNKSLKKELTDPPSEKTIIENTIDQESAIKVTKLKIIEKQDTQNLQKGGDDQYYKLQ